MLPLKTQRVKAEAIEALLYGCSTCPPPGTLHHTPHLHHRALIRIIGAQRKRPDYRMTSYNRAFEIAGCESIETTLRTREYFFVGDAHPNERRAVAKVNRVRERGCSVERTEWKGEIVGRLRTDRIWAFGIIVGDWKATALKSEVWVKTVMEGGRRFMAAWSEEEIDAARHRQEKRQATRLGKLLSHMEA